MVKLLISEAVIDITRNYISSSAENGVSPTNSFERTSLTIEEYFLYEYRTASLEELSERLRLSTRQTQRLIENIMAAASAKRKLRQECPPHSCFLQMNV